MDLAPETQVGLCQVGLLSKLFVFLINKDRILSPFLHPSLFTCNLSMMHGGGAAVPCVAKRQHREDGRAGKKQEPGVCGPH